MKLERHNIALVVLAAILAIMVLAGCSDDSQIVGPLPTSTLTPTPTPALGLAALAVEAAATATVTATPTPFTPVPTQEPPTLLTMEGANIPHGQTLVVDIVADLFPPAGLAGFDITVSTADPLVAVPVLFESPNFGIMQVFDDVPGSLRLAIVDVNKLVQGGASDVLLGTVTFEGVSQGVTAMQIIVDKMDDEDGFPILVNTAPGLLTVSASQDLDGDGLTEDFNANELFDSDDVLTLFELWTES